MTVFHEEGQDVFPLLQSLILETIEQILEGGKLNSTSFEVDREGVELFHRSSRLGSPRRLFFRLLRQGAFQVAQLFRNGKSPASAFLGDELIGFRVFGRRRTGRRSAFCFASDSSASACFLAKVRSLSSKTTSRISISLFSVSWKMIRHFGPACIRYIGSGVRAFTALASTRAAESGSFNLRMAALTVARSRGRSKKSAMSALLWRITFRA